MEPSDDLWWKGHFRAGRKGEPDYVSLDDQTVVEHSENYHGVRGLHADMMGLAAALREKPPGTRGGLVIRRGRISNQRLREAWESGKSALRTELARRLFIVVLDADDPWCDPSDAHVANISRAFTAAEKPKNASLLIRPQSGHKYYEILKVLLLHWLHKDGPQPLGKVGDEVGCTYPTIRGALRRPVLKKYVRRLSMREVELTAFPLQAWQELVALSATHRQSIVFVDRSGTRPSSQDLRKRVLRLGRADVAFGGILSARHWDKTFDLHGTPRINLALHAEDGQADVGFVRRIDPALKVSEESNATAALVVHPIFRAKSFFSSSKRQKELYADPIETVLDLYEMGLNAQAYELLRSFRPEVRVS